MRKIFFFLIPIILLSSCSTSNYTLIKGSEYISMQPNTQYLYKRTALKADKSIFIDIDIQSCNSDQSKCQYFVSVKSDKDKILEQYYETYYVNFFGDVYLTDSLYPNGTLILPARIRLGEELLLDNGDNYGLVQEKLLAYKLIPEIQVNNHEYKNCVNILFETTTPTETVDLKLVTDEITCKGIGSVRKEMQISYKPKFANTNTEDINNSIMKFAATKSISKDMAPEGSLKPSGQKNVELNTQDYILIDTYLDILQAITHK
ncbi:hypothetical protein IBD90_03600 [Francisella tularensis]|uniref:hypothetical protein n=1 Tax=Francisella tularensis TaxID=263 RepID=UPI000A1579E1|nr:hypothetical protein [Francisella tularensis]MBK2149913.1 hypothetical protein [Francisella tularensis]MBK2251018.1 hypothetical protein [Francisella tularensis]NDS80661.1 hypothetical protein [Francisella tularensis subsp. holarctica]NDT60615.1 hypothetical protein [Francisella tularensis subsp. holarctica]ORX28128.1 hypothetical protein ACC30_08960 [Francisella tularensis subsp. holarctica]